MTIPAPSELIKLDLEKPIWDDFFSVSPLILVGTKEENGSYDLAPKSQAMPIGCDNYFAFVCTPRHHTYHNVKRERVFTVSFPRPEQIVMASISAAPRDEDEEKPSLTVLPTFSASRVEGVFLQDAYLFLECQLDRIIDGFGENSLIVGKIVAAQINKRALRVAEQDDQDLIAQAPLLAYLSPGRYAKIEKSLSFPFHTGCHF